MTSEVSLPLNCSFDNASHARCGSWRDYDYVIPADGKGPAAAAGSGDVQEGMQDSLLALHPEISVTYRWTRLVSLALTAAAVTKPHLFLDVMIAF